MTYAVYILQPENDLHFIGRLDTLDQAKAIAKDLVSKGYQRAQVWDPIIPVWEVWQEKGRGVRTTDDLRAIYA